MNSSNNNSNREGEMGSIGSGSDLIDAKLEEHQLCGSTLCPGCGQKLDAKPDWVGLPAGVKFDPTDQELIEHLEAKVEGKSFKSHPLIDEFIPTIEGEDGICYTHPEKLPGVTRDGLSRHFFHRPSKAYTTGTRKRRKIQTECPDLHSTAGETRWHKTGKTRPVLVNGKQKGCKKILVLYTNFGKNRKPEKTNWVMHQYHLGQNEEEKEGELVVSKIFYQTQPRQCNWGEKGSVISGTVMGATGEGSGSGRRESGSGSTSSSMEAVGIGGVGGYSSMDHHHHHQLMSSFVSFRKNFDEVGIGEVTMSAATCDEADHMVATSAASQEHHHHTAVAAAFHVSRPTNAISEMMSPPPQLQHGSLIHHHHHLDDNPYHSLLLPHDSFQEEEQNDKIGGRCASGLEEIIMGCTSSSSSSANHHHLQPESSSMRNTQEDAEWLKYPTFWHHPSDTQDHPR